MCDLTAACSSLRGEAGPRCSTGKGRRGQRPHQIAPAQPLFFQKLLKCLGFRGLRDGDSTISGDTCDGICRLAWVGHPARPPIAQRGERLGADKTGHIVRAVTALSPIDDSFGACSPALVVLQAQVFQARTRQIEPSAAIRERVAVARPVQAKHFKGTRPRTSVAMGPAEASS